MLLRSHLAAALAIVLLALLSAPVGASASKVIAPPGNSGVSQYVEVVPGAGGSVPVGSGGGHAPVLSPSARRRLEAAGASGRALAAFAQRTGVPAAGAGHAKPAHRSANAPHTAGSSAKGLSTLPPGTLAARAARSGTSSGGGLGWGLYVALGAVLLAGLGFASVRRRAG